MLMCQLSEGIACLFWVSWHLHVHSGFQCYDCWTVLVCWSYGLKCQQCKGMAWNFLCWRFLNFYHKRVNHTWQSNTNMERKVEKGTRADVKLCGLAKRKCAIWFIMVVAETAVLEGRHNPLELRLIGVGICHLFWELSVAAIGWSISSSIPGWSTKDSGSDILLWHSPRWELLAAAIGCSAKDSSSDFLPWHSSRGWVIVESVILLGCSAFCFGSLYATKVFFSEKLLRSSASKSIHWLVRKLVRNLVCSLDCWFVAVIVSNGWPKLDFQLPS